MIVAARSVVIAVVVSCSGFLLGACASSNSARQEDRTQTEVGADSKRAYADLLAREPAAAALAKDAKGVLVFPKVLKAGFVVGGYHGKGSMIQNGQAVATYGTTGASYGLQAGIQSYSYAMFFMTEADLQYLDQSDGWEVGTGPSVTVVDKGLATSLTSTTARSGVYCIFFDQKGLMAGIGIQGSKITRLDP